MTTKHKLIHPMRAEANSLEEDSGLFWESKINAASSVENWIYIDHTLHKRRARMIVHTKRLIDSSTCQKPESSRPPTQGDDDSERVHNDLSITK